MSFHSLPMRAWHELDNRFGRQPRQSGNPPTGVDIMTKQTAHHVEPSVRACHLDDAL